ncbi:MAG: DUF84 family protein [Candidatus Pacebacteria bacterium]|nr:DUF84 family protein [Candidatus Paceibacterota bacterium]
MKIFVASKNPVKINAVKIAVSDSYPKAEVIGIEVNSGVSAQPMSDEETLRGSINRAQALKKLVLAQNLCSAQEEVLFIGAEGGVYRPTFANKKRELWSTVWISVLDQEEQVYSASGARFRLPERLGDAVLAGKELGVVVGALFKDAQLKRKSGAIAVLTDNFIDRTEEYASIAKLAIGLWYGRNWQKKLD